MIVIGIQGGRGSFNDSAVRDLRRRTGKSFDVSYKLTTAGVLEALGCGEIDLGQFAIYNSAAGLYDESLYAVAEHVFKIVDRYEMKISHSLMSREDVEPEELQRIITHPQVVKQCRSNIASRCSHLAVEVGTGDLVDPSQVAVALAESRLPRTVAVLSNPLLAELHGLRIVERHMEDVKENASTFLLVAAPEGPSSLED